MKVKVRGFTLIELLVVVGIIALLISILLPSLGAARAQARAVKCGAQMHSIGKAISFYLADSAGIYPPSYWYPNLDGTYDFFKQDPSHPAGYAHWSWFLFNYNKDQRAFTCPEFDQGGLSRTNPGKIGTNWILGQADQNGNTSPTSATIEDLQAPFMAFTMNAAVVGRNKFTPIVAIADGGSGQRLNVAVRQTSLRGEASTILATEFNNNWRTMTAPDNNGTRVIKSHRPISPFIGAGGGSDEYQVPAMAAFARTPAADLYDTPAWLSHVAAGDSLITDPQTQLNAVGRHHPGKFAVNGHSYGGTANFIYVDGHVEKKNIAQTMGTGSAWEWGDHYYSISGNNNLR